MKSNPVVLDITDMKSIGQKEQHYSDDEREWQTRGPNYVQIKACVDDANNPLRIQLKLELPDKLAKQFRVGGKITIS